MVVAANSPLTALRALFDAQSHDASQLVSEIFKAVQSSDIDTNDIRGLAALLGKAAGRCKHSDHARRMKKVLKIESIKPDLAVRNQLQQWTTDRESFFDDQISSSTTIKSGSSLRNLYSILQNQTTSQAITEIKRRFIFISIFRGAVEANYHTGEKWIQGAKSTFAALVEREVDDEPECVEQNLIRFVELGHSFGKWSEALGGDRFLLLHPTTIPEST